ncbi:MAG: polysaccharide biosynthesis protein [Oscillospiraceae bacterium]|nr:polysaccharide biosynthesis protein [Oscillospiraceae bacterium]
MNIKKFLEGKNRRIVLVVFDMLCFLGINILYGIMAAFLEHGMPMSDLKIFAINSLLLFIGMFFFRIFFNIYRTVWRYTSTKSYFMLVMSDFLGSITAILFAYIFSTYGGIWHFAMVAPLTALLTLMSRFTYRLLYKKMNGAKANAVQKNTALIGAGQLGSNLANDLLSNPKSKYRPSFFVDADKLKIGRKVAGLEVFSPEEAQQNIDKYQVTDVIISITKLGNERASELYEIYSGYGCKVKIYDSLAHEVAENDAEKKRVIRDFQIEDLLFRKELSINDKAVLGYYKGKTVLVTGGGGSIGSEICRQIAKCEPKKLVILDIYENNAYDIQQELIRTYNEKLNLAVEIASVRDISRLDYLFRKYRPEVVFHAAAHKHVPLMENSGYEAIKNNILGTYNTADMAEKYGAEKFILISTDKAVNPTNVMGATKRFCEMIVQSRKESKTSFAAVRFGNVLGSNGSVIPLFKKQIEAGGPVTITDKRIIRYFMTIPEASQLVIQAGAMAKRGELFVLDMGKPVKIYDLALNMIRLSGLEPEKDIEIREIGLRPGEKLYEELLIKSETLDKTENNMIFIERDAAPEREEVEKNIKILKNAAEKWDNSEGPDAREILMEIVPTFKNPAAVNKEAEKSEEMKNVK